MSDTKRNTDLDFKVGDRVKTDDGKEASIESMVSHSQRYGSVCSRELMTYFVAGKEYLGGQLTKVGPPKPPESGWLLTEEQCKGVIKAWGEVEGRYILLQLGRVGPEEIAPVIVRAAARHLVEEAMRRNTVRPGSYRERWLMLVPNDWEDLQRAVGLLEERRPT